MSDFVEVILVQLADEAREVAVFEMFGQDGFGESLILRRVRIAKPRCAGGTHLENHETVPFVAPSDHLRIGRILEHSSIMLGGSSARLALGPYL